MENSITVHGLEKHYSGFSLRDVNFRVPQGSIVGFIGENGAGKTTTIKAILGLVHADAGEITVLGQPVTRKSHAANAHVGVVMEGAFFSSTFTTAEVAGVMRLVHPAWDDALYWQLCRRFSLPEKKPYKEFSRGMRVKLAFAAALAHRPQLLVLDEATSGLDPVVRSEMLDLFLEFIQDEQHSILLSSHITSDLERVADYIVFIHEGRIVFELPKDELLEKFAVVKCPRGGQNALAAAHVLGVQESRFDTQVLVDNAPEVRRANPGAVLEPACIDDIMTFFAKGGERE